MMPAKAQRKVAEMIRERRLAMGLTQEGLAERGGVPLSTLRKFEQQGVISLESFLKLVWVVGDLETLVDTLKPNKAPYLSIDDVLKDSAERKRKRGHRK